MRHAMSYLLGGFERTSIFDKNILFLIFKRRLPLVVFNIYISSRFNNSWNLVNIKTSIEEFVGSLFHFIFF